MQRPKEANDRLIWVEWWSYDRLYEEVRKRGESYSPICDLCSKAISSYPVAVIPSNMYGLILQADSESWVSEGTPWAICNHCSDALGLSVAHPFVWYSTLAQYHQKLVRELTGVDLHVGPILRHWPKVEG